ERGTEGGEGFSFPRHKCRGYSYFDLRSFFLDTLIVKYLCDRPPVYNRLPLNMMLIMLYDE
ncbi:MAG: hypothetical protein AB1393_13120, partial [Candidatus Edwardsbacteria bacterium]